MVFQRRHAERWATFNVKRPHWDTRFNTHKLSQRKSLLFQEYKGTEWKEYKGAVWKVRLYDLNAATGQFSIDLHCLSNSTTSGTTQHYKRDAQALASLYADQRVYVDNMEMRDF